MSFPVKRMYQTLDAVSLQVQVIRSLPYTSYVGMRLIFGTNTLSLPMKLEVWEQVPSPSSKHWQQNNPICFATLPLTPASGKLLQLFATLRFRTSDTP